MSSALPQNIRLESGLAAELKQPVLERIHCPLCGSGEADIMLHAFDNLCGVPGRFVVERCRQCRHMFMNPRPTIDTMAHCYPPHYGPHQSTWV